jgi:hypothetical protein
MLALRSSAWTTSGGMHAKRNLSGSLSSLKLLSSLPIKPPWLISSLTVGSFHLLIEQVDGLAIASAESMSGVVSFLASLNATSKAILMSMRTLARRRVGFATARDEPFFGSP